MICLQSLTTIVVSPAVRAILNQAGCTCCFLNHQMRQSEWKICLQYPARTYSVFAIEQRQMMHYSSYLFSPQRLYCRRRPKGIGGKQKSSSLEENCCLSLSLPAKILYAGLTFALCLSLTIFRMMYTNAMMTSSKILPITITIISTTFCSYRGSKNTEKLIIPPELLITPMRSLFPDSEYSNISDPEPVKTCLPCMERSKQLTIPAISLEEVWVWKKIEIAPLKVQVILIFFCDQRRKDVQEEAARLKIAVVDSRIEYRRQSHMLPMWKESQKEQKYVAGRTLAGTGQLQRQAVPSVIVAVKMKGLEDSKLMMEKQMVWFMPGFATQAYWVWPVTIDEQSQQLDERQSKCNQSLLFVDTEKGTVLPSSKPAAVGGFIVSWKCTMEVLVVVTYVKSQCV